MSSHRKQSRRAGIRLTFAVAALLLTASGVGLVTPSAAVASPTTRYVATNGNDNGDANECTDPVNPCLTIQHAVGKSNPDDTVEIAPGTYDEAVTVSSALTLEHWDAMGSGKATIDGGTTSLSSAGLSVTGSSSDEVTIQGLDISGNAGFGVVVDGPSVQITDSTLSDNGFFGLNGKSGSVHFTGSTVSGNGDVGVEFAGSSLALSGSTVSANPGGIDATSGELSIEQTTISGNDLYGVKVNGANATINQSTISNTFNDNGDIPDTAGLIVSSGSAAVNTSTIAGNEAAGVLLLDGTATVIDSTVSNTKPSSSGEATEGGLVDAVASPTSITVEGSIVAAQYADVPDCSGSVSDQGYNLSSDQSCGFTGTGDVIGNPQLGGLADNGGPTETMMLGAGSPARDAIPNNGSSTCGHKGQGQTDPYPVDQRGVGRPINGACDIGAVEAAVAQQQSPPPPSCPALVVVTQSLPDGTVGQPYSQQLQAAGGCDDVYHWTLYSGSLPEGLTLSDSGLISGVPTESGDFTFVVSVNDPAFGTLAIHVNPAPVTTSPTTAPPTTSVPPKTSAPAPSSSSLGVEPVSASASPTQSAPALANTGVTVGSQLRFAWLLLAAGVAMLLAGRMTRRAGRRH